MNDHETGLSTSQMYKIDNDQVKYFLRDWKMCRGNFLVEANFNWD